MITLFNSTPNAIQVLNLFLRGLGIRVSSFTVEKKLLEHPDYPSLLSLTDCLTSWNVPNEAFKINKETCSLMELEFPFIAHLKSEGGRFILARELNSGQVYYSDERDGSGVMSEVDFLKKWDGVVLYAEKDELSGEADYVQSQVSGMFNSARLPFLVLTILLIILYATSLSSLGFAQNSILFLKLAGLAVSCLLLVHSIDANNPLVQNLCSLGRKNNCNTILKSDAAKVTSWLSWSEVGFFYFCGSFICLLLYPESIVLLSWVSVLCLPYTIYSIGYQFKTNNWCLLCCSIQTLLWLEAGMFYWAGYSFGNILSGVNLVSAAGILLCFLFPIAVWSFLKPFLLKAGQVRPLKQQLKIFKYNSALFKQLLSSQEHYSIPDELMPIILGNPKAETVITMVSNPFCGPCGATHKELDEWLSERDDLQLKVVFTTANHDDDNRTKVARHATALSLVENKNLVEKALSDWYGRPSKDYESWADKYPVSYDEDIKSATEKQQKWCEMAEISFTPTILINGYKLVEPYQLSDIKYLLV
ncbi:thioredoxin domain-containing protein [Pedobacter sp. B4-66]|uniref:thioredoxin domain-containing protein n=1 Tax=Pedobacter sp. B4-66 TaxID=2817280 RepID=UPI001BD9B307|nr:thioredoxin domain-containing protein [Pedobacter sp. B4-66]